MVDLLLDQIDCMISRDLFVLWKFFGDFDDPF